MSISTQNKDRISFFINNELYEKLNRISEETNQTLSDLARNALNDYLHKLEKEKLEHELEQGYAENYDYYLKCQESWKYADKG